MGSTTPQGITHFAYFFACNSYKSFGILCVKQVMLTLKGVHAVLYLLYVIFLAYSMLEMFVIILPFW